MKKLQELLHATARLKLFKPFAAVFETLEGIIFGPTEITAGAPHVVDNIEIKRYMTVAIIALLPSTISGIVFFGWRVLLMIIASYVAGGIVEVAFALIRKREIEEGFLVTGLIFPLILPPTAPIWVVVVGSAVGVFFGKEVFGGTGRNIFNPALVGRLFVTIAFPQIMSASWQKPFSDAITTATPLASYKSAGELTGLMDLLMGSVAGSIGEVFRIGIIAGGIFLMLTKVANWRIPVSYLASVALFSWIGNLIAPDLVAPPLFQLLAGGLLFGAMFMATDPVTSPFNHESKFIFGGLCGLVTVVIRSFSGYTEGVMFSIIFMNALTPLIDHFVLKVKYRTAK
ncbi:MAG: RnfABCDGE type electron transport complex subunit D [Spirochaetales bacterium]|nr:RnfABCDGE type electron transport complex subunit D [Spirochaetales bacterium]